MTQPTTLYRLFSADETLLYVGISKHALARIGEHARDKAWYRDIATMTLVHYPTRADAERAERVAIAAEKPIHNIARPRPFRTDRDWTLNPENVADWCESCADRQIEADSEFSPERLPIRWEIDGPSARCFYHCTVCGHRWSCWWSLEDHGTLIGGAS